MPTPRQHIRATTHSSATSWEAVVVAFNLYARTMMVNAKDVGTFTADISRSVDVGTSQRPEISVGDTVRVERMNNRYLVTDVLAKAVTQLSGQFLAYSPQTIEAPEWVPPYPRIIGAQLEGLWTVVSTAQKYQVWSNTSPTQDGATLVGEFVQNQFAKTLNSSYAELIADNRGFENGDLRGWTGYSNLGWVPSATYKHSGNFGARSQQSAGIATITSRAYKIGASRAYEASVWAQAQWELIDAEYRALTLSVMFYDVDGALITTATANGNPASSSWQQIVASGTTPSNADTFAITVTAHDTGYGIVPLPGYFYLHVDDCSLKSYEPATTNLLYAVRAVSANNVMSPFSSWQQPAPVEAALGDPNAVHAKINPNGTIESSNFVAGASGYRASEAGIEGACVVSATEPASLFLGMLWLDTSAGTLKICKAL